MLLPYWVFFGNGKAVRVHAQSDEHAAELALIRLDYWGSGLINTIIAIELDYERC